MSEPIEPLAAAPDENELTARADPTFKRVTNQAAEAAGLRAVSAEFPQLLTADLVLEIPPEAKLEGTLFSFLQGFDYAILDFKGQNDNLDMTKFLVNVARTALFASRHPEIAPSKVLNLIVSSRHPYEWLSQAGEEITANPDAQWLWRGNSFYQSVALVVCRDLPLEPTFYNWLLFSPANSTTWRGLIRKLIQEGRRDLLEIIRQMRPKEYRDMALEYIMERDPKEQPRLIEETLELIEAELDMIQKLYPDGIQRVKNKIDSINSAQSSSDETASELTQTLESEQVEQIAESLSDDKVDELIEALLRRKKRAEGNEPQPN